MAAFATGNYPLRNSAILDSGATIHVFNQISRFLNFRTANPNDCLWAGEGQIKIQGYGDVDLALQTPAGGRITLRLHDVAFVPEMATSLVSLRLLRNQGIWWDTRPQKTRLCRQDGTVLGIVEERFDQYVIEYVSPKLDRAALYARRNRYNSWTERSPQKQLATRWHLRMGHPGAGALEHLVNSAKGVRIKGITTTQCDSCAKAKLKRQIRRQPRDLQQYTRGEKLAIDFHDWERDLEGYRSQMLFTCRKTEYSWDFYLQDRKTETLIKTLDYVLTMLKTQYDITVRNVEMDNEMYSQKPQVAQHLEKRGIKLEPSPAYTQDLNGAAERSGGVIKEKASAMRDTAKLPSFLWREISATAVYLRNRTPRRRLGWKTPFQLFHSRSGEQRQPSLAHLRVFGCKAYAMTTKALQKSDRLKRFHPRAWVGFLIGYQSSNTYRIWNPLLNKVVHTRDVIFNEDEVFSGDIAELKDDLRDVSPQDLEAMMRELSIQSSNEIQGAAPQGVGRRLFDYDADATFPPNYDPEELLTANLRVTASVMSTEDSPQVASSDVMNVEESIQDAVSGVTGTEDTPWGSSSNAMTGVEASTQGTVAGVMGTEDTPQESSSDVMNIDAGQQVAEEGKQGTFDPYPTPPQSPPAALMTALMSGSTSSQESQDGGLTPAESWKGAFHAATRASVMVTEDKTRITRSVFERRQRSGKAIHRKELPAPPNRHEELDNHPLGSAFKEAELSHLRDHEQVRSWIEIDRRDPQVRGHQILDCRWVYVYKFDKHGRYQKAKARLVVRGDQQFKQVGESNYAATLAGRSFRTVMAIAARFDLELKQYDAVNAFVNANLDEDVFMKMPPGHRRVGTVLKLKRALYGLRRSPLLWQRMLTQMLRAIGYTPVPHEPCAFTRNGVIIFFYVDDIVVVYRKQQEKEANVAVEQLQSKCRITGGDDLKWFLGIEILRDRKRRLIWLSQSSYLTKIAQLNDSKVGAKGTPMTKDELLPFNGMAAVKEVRNYQRKVGSVLYAAVITRPDIAFATSRLARHLLNPGPQHHKAADRVLGYLYETRFLALQLGGRDDLQVASDASFADNTRDRKSSQAYAIKLFGGLIAWRANKQDTVTTSTTEAELLALAQASKEALFVSRLVKELGVRLDDSRITVECDNKQTIRLVTEEIATLKTNLRHVDIHNHWLRQEVERNRIRVAYTKSAEMMADGLTKTLFQDRFNAFREMVGLVDTKDRVEGRHAVEAAAEMETKTVDTVNATGG